MRLPREALVVCQIAVAVVLLVGTGLLLRTFVNLRGSELGFRPEQVLTLRTTLPLPRYAKHSDRLAFFDRVVIEQVKEFARRAERGIRVDSAVWKHREHVRVS